VRFSSRLGYIGDVYEDIIDGVGKTIDAVGVAVIAVGLIYAIVVVFRRPATGPVDRYREFRQTVGRSILLGLELLVAGDIIRTVAVSPSFVSVGVLAIIVVIRTFLSFTLELELTGRWPWSKRPPT
jgi:uncharacterized membrane protein